MLELTEFSEVILYISEEQKKNFSFASIALMIKQNAEFLITKSISGASLCADSGDCDSQSVSYGMSFCYELWLENTQNLVKQSDLSELLKRLHCLGSS